MAGSRRVAIPRRGASAPRLLGPRAAAAASAAVAAAGGRRPGRTEEVGRPSYGFEQFGHDDGPPSLAKGLTRFSHVFADISNTFMRIS